QARASLHPKTDMTTTRKKATPAKSAAAKPGAGPVAKPRAAAAARSALLDPIFAAIRKRAGKARQEDASAFAAAFYLRLTEDELPLHSADGWAALANDFLDFARKRKPGTASIRLFNP